MVTRGSILGQKAWHKARPPQAKRLLFRTCWEGLARLWGDGNLAEILQRRSAPWPNEQVYGEAHVGYPAMHVAAGRHARTLEEIHQRGEVGRGAPNPVCLWCGKDFARPGPVAARSGISIAWWIRAGALRDGRNLGRADIAASPAFTAIQPKSRRLCPAEDPSHWRTRSEMAPGQWARPQRPPSADHQGPRRQQPEAGNYRRS